MRQKVFLACLLLIAILVWIVWQLRDAQTSAGDTTIIRLNHDDAVSLTSPDPPIADEEEPDPNDPRLNRLPDGRVEYNLALNTSRRINQSSHPDDNLYVFDELFRHYRYAYGENPVGTDNFEITEQLLGKNPMKIVFIEPKNPAVVGNELVDQWGTAYFFHSVSAENMEVRSAGPDRRLWTEDDIFHDD